MARAIWNGKIVAESENVVQVVDVIYFPFDSVKKEYLKPSNSRTYCFWKGEASYYNLCVDGKENPNAAWCYEDPSAMAENVRGKIAFWKEVEIEI